MVQVISFLPSAKACQALLPQLQIPKSGYEQMSIESHHLAALAIDPYDRKVKILLSQAARGNEKWGLFKSSEQVRKEGFLERILAHQTAEFYKSISPQNYLSRCCGTKSGPILNIVSVAFAEREVLLTRAANRVRKNFFWVPVDDALAESEAIMRSSTLDVGQGRKIIVDGDFSLLLSHKQEVKLAADTLMTTSGCSREKMICISNHLNEILEDIKIVTDDSLMASIDCLKMLMLQRIPVSLSSSSHFWVEVNFMDHYYCFFIDRPIRSINQLVFEHDVKHAGVPFLAYSSTSDESTGSKMLEFYKAPLIESKKSPSSQCMVECSVPDVEVRLFSANIDIAKIKIKDKQGRVVRGMPMQEKAMWLIPTYKNQGPYYLEICMGDLVYLWKVRFLSSSCDLMIIKDMVTQEPTLFLCLEGVFTQEVKVPLVKKALIPKAADIACRPVNPS
jgi:hypothetical protein